MINQTRLKNEVSDNQNNSNMFRANDNSIFSKRFFADFKKQERDRLSYAEWRMINSNERRATTNYGKL
jgi:hypothetical protein